MALEWWKFLLKEVEIENQHCLRRFKQMRCERCVRACPAKAISPSFDNVILDKGKCNLCGLCYLKCPTEAIKSSFYPYGLYRENDFVYFCSASLKEDFSSCLGWLDLGRILLPLSDKAERVILSPGDCSGCIPEVGNVLKRMVKIGSEVLGHFTRAGEILYKPFFLDSLTRRESLFLLKEKTLETSARRFFTSHEGGSYSKRKWLLLALQNLGKIREEKIKSGFLPWGELKIEAGKCDLCGVCFHLCPSQALQLTGENGSVVLAQQPSRCLKCGLCVKICPQKAAHLLPKNDLRTFIEERRHFLVRGQFKSCSKCDSLFLRKLEEDTCINCRKLEDLRAEIKVTLGGKIASSKR